LKRDLSRLHAAEVMPDSRFRSFGLPSGLHHPSSHHVKLSLVVLLLICRPFHLRLPDPFTPRIRTAPGKGVGWHRPPSDGLQWTRKLCNNQQSQVARITRILFHKVIVLPSCSIGTMKECITDRLTASRAGTLEGFLLSYLIITRSLITNVPKNQIRLLYACTRLLLVVLLLKAYTGSCQRISSPWNMIVGAL